MSSTEKSRVRCHACRKQIPADCTECPDCGMPQVTICARCGETSSIRAAGCPTCGARFQNAPDSERRRQRRRRILSVALMSLLIVGVAVLAHLVTKPDPGREKRREQEAAHSAFSEGNFQSARLLLRAHMEKYGETPGNLKRLGIANLKLGKQQEAVAALERAIALAPGNAEPLRLLTEIEAVRGRDDRALLFGRRALRGADEEDQPRIHLILGRILAGRGPGHAAEAARHLQQAIDAGTCENPDRLILGDLVLQRVERTGRLDEQSRRRIEHALDLDPGPEAGREFAVFAVRAHYVLGNYEAVLARLNGRDELDPREQLILAKVAVSRRGWAAGTPVLIGVAERHPGPEGLGEVVRFALNEGQVDVAQEAIQRTEAALRKNARATRSVAALVRSALGRPGAEGILKTLLSLHPDDEFLRAAFAEALLGRPSGTEEAEAFLRSCVVEVAPSGLDLLLAEILLASPRTNPRRADRIAEARRILKRASVRPNLPPELRARARVLRGRLALIEGEADLARRLLEPAVALDPDAPTPRILLAAAYRALDLPSLEAAQLDDLIRLRDGSATDYLDRAEARMESGHALLAASDCREAMLMAPRSLRGLRIFARAKAAVGEFKAAIAALKSAAQQPDAGHETTLELALLLVRSGATREGWMHFRGLISAADDLPMAIDSAVVFAEALAGPPGESLARFAMMDLPGAVESPVPSLGEILAAAVLGPPPEARSRRGDYLRAAQSALERSAGEEDAAPDYRSAALVLAGNLSRLAGDTDALIRICRRHAELAPDSDLARARLVVGLLLANQPRAAEAEAAATARAAPDDLGATTLHSVALRALERDEESVQVVLDFVAGHPKDPEGAFLAGKLLLLGGRLDEAEVYLREALRLDPDQVPAAEVLATHLLRAGRGEEATTFLTDLAERSKKRGEVRFLLGSVALARDAMFDEAVAILESAREAGISDPAVKAALWAKLMAAHLLRSDPGAAEKEATEFSQWARSTEKRPFTGMVARVVASAWSQAGSVHRERGGKERAASCYRQALELDGSNLPALNNLSAILAADPNTLPEALALARRAVERAPGRGEVWDTLGVILLKLSDRRGALEAFDRASKAYRIVINLGVEKAAGANYRRLLAETLVRAAMCRCDTGDTEGARAALREAKSAYPKIQADATYGEASERLR